VYGEALKVVYGEDVTKECFGLVQEEKVRKMSKVDDEVMSSYKLAMTETGPN